MSASETDRPVAIVTGASSGIGRATAKLLAESGYRVIGSSREPKSDTLDGFALLPLEVTSDESVAAFVKSVSDRTGGRIDVLVSNVGTGILGAAEESTADEARGLFDINVFGAFRVVNAVLPTFRRQKAGKLVVMSSAGGIAAVPFAAYYCATKFALEGYCESLRHELLPLGISVTVIGPGAVSTSAGDSAPESKHPIADYEPGRSKAVKAFAQGIRDGMPPAKVARAILDAVTSSSPPPRIVVGNQARAVSVARWALPRRTFQWLVRKATR